MYYINTIKKELSADYPMNILLLIKGLSSMGIGAYGCFVLCVDETIAIFFLLDVLHKFHMSPYKSRFIANSSSCTTTELSILLTS